MKFFKVCLLLSAYIFLWGINSFAFNPLHPQTEILGTSQNSNTHLIPLMMVDGTLVKAQDLAESISDGSIPLEQLLNY